MANNHNKNISIDVDISANGLEQLDQYKLAFEDLRKSIDNLSAPLEKLDSGINALTESTNKLHKESNVVDDVIGKVKSGFERAEVAVKAYNAMARILKITVIELETALSGGLAILLIFGPEILKWATSLLKGKEAIDQAKLSLNALNKGISSTEYSKAIENVTSLKIKIDLAKRGFTEKAEVVTEYNKTLGKTIGQVKTLDQVETALKNNSDNYIKAMLAKATAMQAIKEASDNMVLAAKERNKSDEESVDYMLSGLDKTDKLYKKNAKDNREEAAKPFEDKAAQLQKIAKHYLVDVNNLNKQIEENNPANVIKKQLDNLEKFADARIKGSKTFRRIQLLKKELADLQNPPTPKAEGKKVTFKVIEDNGLTQEELAEAGLAIRTKTHIKQIQQKAKAFEQEVEQRTRNYNNELAALKQQENQKLISQEEYFESWEKLQEKYHAGIGETLKLFNERDLARTQKHQRDLVEAEQLKADKKGVEDAVWPAQKLAAEKKLIEDKYTFEIQKAAEAGKDTAEIRERYQTEITETTKKHEQERKDFQMQTAQQVSDAAFSILRNNGKAQSDAKLKQLDTQKQAELANTSLTGSQKKAIEEKYKKKEAEEKTKAFKAEQRTSILQAVINGALAITKVTAQTGVLSPFIIPGIIASTAIQVATIAAQKTPQYAKGGLHYQSDGKGALLSGYSRTDDTNAYLRSGEAVVVSEAMRNPWARNLVSAINVAHGGRDFSIANPSRGYAIGGIFTDGGNSNRYYNQPMNDQKDLANTIAYQMINNFPPVYVDVKDINSQQSILAQTVNRVNL